jgi:hypothetical protein
MTHQGFVALAALVSVAFLAPGADAAPLKRERAQTAPVDVLTREALTAVMPRFVEVSRPTYSGMIAPGKTVSSLWMATAPRAAGSPGLCEADTVLVDFRSDKAPLSSSTAYKVAGKLAPLPDLWNDAYEAGLKRKCANAGPVIPPEDGDLNQVAFFHVRGDAHDQKAWLSARALELAIERAGRGELEVTCGREPPKRPQDLAPGSFDERMETEGRQGCASPQAALAKLDLSRLAGIDIVPCPSLAENLCISAEFLREASGGSRALWIVNLQASYPEIGARDIKTIGAVTLADQVWIYD